MLSLKVARATAEPAKILPPGDPSATARPVLTIRFKTQIIPNRFHLAIVLSVFFIFFKTLHVQAGLLPIFGYESGWWSRAKYS